MKAFLLLASLAAAAAHAGDVTVIRPSSIISDEWSFYLFAGGDRPVTDLRSGEHVTFKVPAGTQSLVVHCPRLAIGTYDESRLEYAFRDAPAYFIIEPAPHCVKIEAVDARRAAAQVSRTRPRPANRVVDYDKAVEAPKVAQNQKPAAVTEGRETVAAATAAWVEAFNSRDAARLCGLYDTDAVLLDLDSRSPVSGSAAISQHYASVSRRPTARVALGERSIRLMGETAIDSGTATVFEMRDGNATTTPVRDSVTYRNRGGRWLIVDHQLSPAPR